MLEVGIEGKLNRNVTDKDTAITYKSGELNVFATPAMAAFMEQTAWTSIADYLEPGMSSVGTMLHITHVAPTPIGMNVTCESRLTKVEGRKLGFELKVYDEAGLIGEGTHERVIIDGEKFQKKANEKKR